MKHSLIKQKSTYRRAAAAVLAAALAVASLTGCSEAASQRPELLDPLNANLETAPVERGELGSIAIYNAVVEPDIREIGFDIDGYVYGIYVRAGQEIEEGDVIASIVGQSFREISNLEDELETLEEDDADRFKLLEAELELRKLNGEDTEESELELRHSKEMAALKLRQKQERLERLKAGDQGYKYITAEDDCTVIAAASMRQGSYLTAGTPVCAVMGDGDFCITCSFLSEKAVSRLSDYYAILHGVRFDVDYIPYTKEELAEKAAAGATPLSVFKLKTDSLSAEQQKIIAETELGDYALIMTEADHVEDVLIVPVNAIYSDQGGKFVYEVVDNTRTKRYVRTGVSDSVNIQIISGIGEGAYVYVKN